MLHYVAFPDGPGGGNPAGVVLDAGGLDDAARLAVAAALGYSETALLDATRDEPHRLRFWSPLAEVAFCGHATIATDELDPGYPPHVAWAGNAHLVLAAATRARLAELDYDFPALAALMAARSWTTLHLVHAQTPTLFHARDPFPPGGVVEDPATGAAAAAFGGYLRTLGRLPLPAQVTVLQGEDMGRPSRLTVDIDADTDVVRVTGGAAPLPPG